MEQLNGRVHRPAANYGVAGNDRVGLVLVCFDALAAEIEVGQ